MYELKILTLSVCPHREGLKNMPDHGGIFFKPSQCGYTLRVSLLRRGLHEVSSEGKVSAQGVMGRAK
jgi:hypothetical protein